MTLPLKFLQTMLPITIYRDIDHYTNIKLHNANGTCVVWCKLNINIKTFSSDSVVIKLLAQSLHRPSLVLFYKTGQIQEENWYFGNVHHRWNGPAKTCFYQNGTPSRLAWYHHCKYHNTNGPSYYDNSTLDMRNLYQNGLSDRRGGLQKMTHHANDNIKCQVWCTHDKIDKMMVQP